MTPKFIQIHFLAAWPGALLNRDDAGLAKRLPFGTATRTRISSQCMKRRWRCADDPHSILTLAEEVGGSPGVRSRKIFTRGIVERLVDEGYEIEATRAVTQLVHSRIFPKKDASSKKSEPKAKGSDKDPLDMEQAILLGQPEIDYVLGLVRRVLDGDGELKSTMELKPKTGLSPFQREFRDNLEQLGKQAVLSRSLEAALFGRMVTSDLLAQVEAPIHVAHAFTVHSEQPELDYFAVVDDLKTGNDDAGAAGVFDTELTSGLYYGYVVVDLPLLVSNLTGCKRGDWASDQDRDLAARVVENLVHLVAEVSPGAKKGSTAPYSRAELVLVEAGDRQPRTLANAFRDPVSLDRGLNEPLGRRTADAMARFLADMDEVYATGEARRHMAVSDLALPKVDRANLAELAAWAGDIVRTASVEGSAA